MKEFNQNPFLKNTSVVPFSNASEAESWHDANCDKCKIYEAESKNSQDAKCILAYYIDYGFVEGTIPLWVAKEIGCGYNPLYQTCNLHNKCRKFNNGDENNPF